MMLERGDKVGRFVVVRELGSGGMGAVYAAHDPQLDRQVALKVLRETRGDEEDRVRMLREGQAMARVTHANVITVYEVGTEGDMVFLAQELLDGGTLGTWLESQHAQDDIIAKFIAAGRGLAAAHAAGLVHRDFKPDNVLLGKDGRVRVADFGLARGSNLGAEVAALAVTARGGGPPQNDVDVTKSPMDALTRTGTVMGTPMFMAPEQHKGERADARCDQFAFCVSLYHALYRAWPFEGKSAPALADAVIEGRLEPPPKAANVSPALRKIVVRGLATDPAARYPTMDALLADLERLRTPARPSRLPIVLGVALIVLGGGGAATYVALRSRSSNKPVVTGPPPPTDVAELTTEKGVAWLSSAIDRGQLGEAIEKYELLTRLAEQAQQPAAATIARAAGVYLRVLRGDDLAKAAALLADAEKKTGGDATAQPYIDLAQAALALARGQLAAARDRATSCGTALEKTAPVLASICSEVEGQAFAALGDSSKAAFAYDTGIDDAAQQSEERISTLRLARAQLLLDEQKLELAGELAKEVGDKCGDRVAVGCEVRARILLARVQLQQGPAQQALDYVTPVKAKTIESVPVRLEYEIALGQVHGELGETGEDGLLGLDRIERARSEAEVKGLVGLMLEAKLARVRVMLVRSMEGADAEARELVKQARAAKYERIATLVGVYLKELAEPARDMLPADGGLPAVRPGPPGDPTDVPAGADGSGSGR
jgi:hypothetical protein